MDYTFEDRIEKLCVGDRIETEDYGWVEVLKLSYGRAMVRCETNSKTLSVSQYKLKDNLIYLSTIKMHHVNDVKSEIIWRDWNNVNKTCKKNALIMPKTWKNNFGSYSKWHKANKFYKKAPNYSYYIQTKPRKINLNDDDYVFVDSIDKGNYPDELAITKSGKNATKLSTAHSTFAPPLVYRIICNKYPYKPVFFKSGYATLMSEFGCEYYSPFFDKEEDLYYAYHKRRIDYIHILLKYYMGGSYRDDLDYNLEIKLPQRKPDNALSDLCIKKLLRICAWHRKLLSLPFSPTIQR